MHPTFGTQWDIIIDISYVPEKVVTAVSVGVAAVHAQDGGGVEGDYGIAGELAEEDESRRNEDPRGGSELGRRRCLLLGIASALGLALK